MNKIGILQGRLSKPLYGKIQSFPVDSWRNEFITANKIGFDAIEWVIDSESADKNPFILKSFQNEILDLSKENNVDIPAICCDFLMDSSLHKGNSYKSLHLFEKVIEQAILLNVSFIEIPLIGDSGIENLKSKIDFIESISKFLDYIKNTGLNFLLETSLKPTDLREFISSIDNKYIFLNYDMGNSAFWNFDPREEIDLLFDYIKNIHVKDCTPELYSVPLGEGNVDFNFISNELHRRNYSGDFILQTCRGSNDIQTAKYNLEFVKTNLIKP